MRKNKVNEQIYYIHFRIRVYIDFSLVRHQRLFDQQVRDRTLQQCPVRRLLRRLEHPEEGITESGTAILTVELT